MKKGQILKCLNSKKSGYLTNGKNYKVSVGAGDVGDYGLIPSGDFTSFEIIDDEGDLIFQGSLDGLHGEFEVIS